MPALIRFLLSNAVRITHAPPGTPERPWLEHVLLPAPTVSPEQARLAVSEAAGCIRVTAPDGTALLEEARPAEVRADGHIRLTFCLRPGEGFYGGGEWFNAFRRERGVVHLRARESPALLQHRQTYSTLPFFLSDRGYGLFLLNSHASTWRWAPERGMLEVDAVGPPADYVVFYGPGFKEIVGAYTALTGRPPLLPRWAFGLWVTGYPQAPQDEVVAHVAEHRRRAIPLDAVILDYHWEERFHNFRWRREIVPDPDRLIADLRAQGVRLGLILTPFQNNRTRWLLKALLYLFIKDIPPALFTADERALPEYEAARAHGYFAHARAVWWFGGGGMVDFTNPAAAAWWNARLKPLYDQGVAFFKNDDGEYLPDDAVSALGMDGREYHNLYGFFYGRALYEGMAALDDRRPLVYARSVWAGSQRYPALFLGDQKPTFDHIRSTLRAGLNLGLAGFAYWTADVFGLDGQTTPEIHMRYAQWALLVPVARYFIRPPAVDATRFPWSHNAAVEANFRACAQLRYRLLPTYSALAWEAHQTGLPLLRPLLLEFPDDPRLRTVEDELMLGPSLLLAPVVESGATRRRIVLPAGQWHDFWTDRSWEGGGTIEYDAPLERLPLLVRGGSLLLLGPPLECIPDNHRFDQLELHAWPPYPATTLLYDDDGQTRAYERGACSVTRMTAEASVDGVMVCISAAEGSFPEQVTVREITVVLHRTVLPAGVTVNGRPAAGWEYTGDETRIVVACPVGQETIVAVPG